MSVYSPKESSLKNSSSGSYCFDAILLVLWFGNIDTPTTRAFIVVGGRGGGGSGGGGGGGAYFAKKIDLSVFSLRLLYINKQYDVLISDMISKIVYECLIKSSEYFLLFFV